MQKIDLLKRDSNGIQIFPWRVLWLVGLVVVNLELYVSKHDFPSGKRISFAVVDLDKSGNYPMNFVCMLPLHVALKGNMDNVFVKVFGEKRLQMAEALLTKALNREEDLEVKAEIERRVKLLDPESANAKICVSCGKTFQVSTKKRFKQRFCENCVRRKFGGRN